MNEDSAEGAFDELTGFVTVTPSAEFSFIQTAASESRELEVGV